MLAHLTLAMSLASAPPNFLVLFVDDMGINQIQLNTPGVYGYTGDGGKIQTPNIAAMADEGMTFQHWYSSFHYCSPSRGSMLTGRLPVRLGIGIPPMDEPMGGPSCGPPLEGVEGLVMVVPRFGSVRVPKPSPLFFLKIGIES